MKKPVSLYKKTTKFELVGNETDLQSIMHDVHKFIGEHKFIKGGKTRKKVHVKHTSTKPVKVFEGII